MSFHRQRQPRKGRTQQMDFACEEAPEAICRERINDTGPVRRIAGLSKSKRQTQIICRAGLIEINERWKISLVGAELESASQPRVLFAGARTLDERIEGAAQPLARSGTARKLLLAHRIQIAPPCVAVTAPMGMQYLGRHVARANVKPGATLITDGRGPWVGRGLQHRNSHTPTRNIACQWTQTAP